MHEHRLTTAHCVVLCIISLLGALPCPSSTWAGEQTGRLAEAFNRSGLELFERLASNPGNLVISPYSIGTAMTMALSGARGETEAEMARVLDLGIPTADVADAEQRLNAALTDRVAQGDIELGLANAIHLTKHGDLVANSYRQLLTDKFGAELFSGSDLASINQWVRQKTNGKINEILARLDPNSVCVVLNAIHLKAPWASPFNKKITAPGPFQLSKDETVEVPMMRQTGRYRILRAHMFDAVALPYRDNKLSMIVLLPMRLAGQGQVAISLTDKTIGAVMDGLRQREPEQVQLTMPKFKTEFAANLISPLRGLGMTLAFDKDRADFSGITESTREDDRIHISQIQHKTLIDVDEEGTEAAGATAVEFAKRAPPSSTVIKVDRPFLYLIADETTGAVLFMGRMSDPRMK